MAHKADEGFCVYGAEVLSRHLSALRQEIEGVRLADDIEYVHRMRVASRRLRSALPQFLECFGKKDSQRWLRQIRDITRALGAARDTDVQLDALQKFAANNPDPIQRTGLRRLMLRLAQRRSDLQHGVTAALDQLENSGALAKMEKQLTPLLDQRERVYLYTPYLYLRGYEAIRQHLAELLAYEPFVEQAECITELHAMRIAAKRLRYTMELFASIYPGELKGPLGSVKKVQEQLGDLHDCDVWAEFLPRFLTEEETLTRQFYGHTRSFRRVVPGVQAFADERAAARQRVYSEFVATWRKTTQNGIWTGLQDAIRLPYHHGEQPAGAAATQSGSTGEKS